MNKPRNFSAAYIVAWCEEWNLDPQDRRLLLQRYAEGDDEWDLLGFMADLAREQRIELDNAGRLVRLSDFLRDSRNWQGKHNST